MIRLICLGIGYVFGLFQTSYILGRSKGIDIRDYGSGNAGTTNMLRTMGTGAGILTFLGDCIKCILAVVAVRLLFRNSHAEILPLLCVYAGAGVILGHNFPFYLNFRGGKGIAATAGLVLSFGPVLTAAPLLVFIVTVLATNYVSLGSLLVYICLVIEFVIFGQTGFFKMDQVHLNELYVLIFLLAVLAFWKHRKNIRRLLDGTETKSHLFKKKK